MTPNTNVDRCIDRRTALSLLGGGVAALAGCSGGSSESEQSDADGSSSGQEYPDSGWIDPANHSEYVTSSEIVADEYDVLLQLQLQNSTDIYGFELVDARGNRFSGSSPDRGTAEPALATNVGLESVETESITPGENTLVVEKPENNRRIPFRLGTSIEFKRVEIVNGSVGGGVNGGYYTDGLGIVVKNTGSHSTVAWRTDYSNTPNEGSGYSLHAPRIIQPGETQLVPHESEIWRAYDSLSDCDSSARTLEFTVRFLWSDNISISQRINYDDVPAGTCGSLDGEATVTTGQSTESDG